jgi:hypothetical protein
MRKLITAVILGVGVVAMSTAAFAGPPSPIPGGLGTYQTGQGKNGTCGGTTTAPCPTDGSASDPNLLPAGQPLYVGNDSGAGTPPTSGHIAVAIGDEGKPNSVGRVSFGGSSTSGAQVYGEDYTTGDQVASSIRTVNQATGCKLIAPTPPDTCATPNSDDSILVSLTPPAP